MGKRPFKNRYAERGGPPELILSRHFRLLGDGFLFGMEIATQMDNRFKLVACQTREIHSNLMKYRRWAPSGPPQKRGHGNSPSPCGKLAIIE